jgi:hypothetical protein
MLTKTRLVGTRRTHCVRVCCGYRETVPRGKSVLRSGCAGGAGAWVSGIDDVAEWGRDDMGMGTPEQWRAVGINGRHVACGRATGRGSAPAVAGDACADDGIARSLYEPDLSRSRGRAHLVLTEDRRAGRRGSVMGDLCRSRPVAQSLTPFRTIAYALVAWVGVRSAVRALRC